jgi:Fungal protein kinase
MVDLTSSVFPDSALPFAIDDDFIDKCRGHLTDKRYNWGKNEKALAKFLNTICAAIAAASGKPILRVWNASYCDKILEGSPIRRKPDVVLLDHDFRGTPRWQDIRAVAEVTKSKSEHTRIIRTVTDKTYIMLNSQPNRFFVPIISAWNNTKFRLTVTDRQGQLRTKTFNIEYGVRRADLLILFRILVGLCFGNEEAVGYDPTMIMGRDNVEAIMCAGMRFNVIRLIYATQSLIGRATHVWEVEHEGGSHILKDAWVERSRPVSEAKHLQNIGEMEGIPMLFCSEDISIDGVPLSTGRLRHGIYGNSDMERIRRRIVTSSCGSHIAEFHSKRELISALKDIVVSASCFHFFIPPRSLIALL